MTFSESGKNMQISLPVSNPIVQRFYKIKRLLGEDSNSGTLRAMIRSFPLPGDDPEQQRTIKEINEMLKDICKDSTPGPVTQKMRDVLERMAEEMVGGKEVGEWERVAEEMVGEKEEVEKEAGE